MTSTTPERTLKAIARDLRGLLTPLTRPFDIIDEYTLNQLLTELASSEATEAGKLEELAKLADFIHCDASNWKAESQDRIVIDHEAFDELADGLARLAGTPRKGERKE